MELQLTRRQVELIATEFSLRAGEIQYRGAKCAPHEDISAVTEWWKEYLELANTAAHALGYASYMVPGPTIEEIISTQSPPT